MRKSASFCRLQANRSKETPFLDLPYHFVCILHPHEGMESTYNQFTSTLNRWNGEGSSNTMPRAIYADPNRNNRASTRWVEDGSYLRLKNLTFGYRFTQDWLKKIGAKSLRLYLSFDNLWTLTNYSGLDPEVGLWGLDYGIYPTSRVYMFGASVKF